MDYTRLNLSNGTVIDETHFKHIEDGIVAAVTAINESLNGAGGGITDTAKTLILSLFEGAAYGNSEMQTTLTSLKNE